MTRVAVLVGGGGGLAHGTPDDALAADGVLEAAGSVEAAVASFGWTAVRVEATRDLARYAREIGETRADVAFHLVEAVGGEARLEAVSAGVLEWLGLPYTGSTPRALLLALEKPLARAWLEAHGVPVPRGAVLDGGHGDASGLPWPRIVKPSREDASHGIGAESVVSDERAMRARAAWVRDTYAQPALVEEFVDGIEVNVAVLGEGERAEVLPLSQIDFSRLPAGRPRLVTYASKWVEGSPDWEGTNPFFPHDMDPHLAARIREVALAAYRAVGVRDYGRVDLRVHPERGPLVLEVNPNPDLSPAAGLARAAAKAGLDHPRLVRRVLEGALARAAQTPAPR
jgi:D-alanine-D-alanine ligase